MSASGRKASTWDIRRSVEEYDGMADQAFDRRFYADREELSRLGIEILGDGAESHAGGFPEGTLYWLPPENYCLPPIEFSREELAGLGTCLCLLGGQFAYGDVLRLALQGLTLGAGDPLDERAPDYISVSLLSSGFDAAAADRLAKVEAAITRNKTLLFDYHTLGRDKVEPRRVDPYSLMFTRGDWYLVGYSHERADIRVFKLRRIQGKIRNATRSAHDFSLPAGFDSRLYESLEPWQLGPEKGIAVIELSPRIAWWVERNLGHCGDVETREDDSAVFTTSYSDPAQLCSLVLGMESDATLREPPPLRLKMRELLHRIAELHTGPAAEPALPTDQPTEQPKSTSPRQVKPERFIQLSTLIAFLIDRLGDEETAHLPVADVCAQLGYETPQDLKKDLELLLLVSIDTGGYLVEGYVEGDTLRVERCVYSDVLKQPARLSPLGARALLLAIDLVGGHVLAGDNRCLQTAREKIVRAAGGLDEEQQTIIVSDSGREDAAVSRAIALGVEERRLVEIEFLSQHGARPRTRRVEPYLVTNTNGVWYVVSYCREAKGVRAFGFDMIKSANLLDEQFEPRKIDLDLYRDNPRLPSGREAPFHARVRFSPGIARFVCERRPSAMLLEDGSIVDEIPYFNQEWLAREILKYGGEAVVIEPEGMRRLVANTARELAEIYS